MIPLQVSEPAMAQAIRIGVLGLTHDHVWDNLGPLVAMDGAELVAAADRNRPLLDRISSDYGCATYETPDAMLDAESLDAVYVFASNAEGADLAVSADGTMLFVGHSGPFGDVAGIKLDI